MGIAQRDRPELLHAEFTDRIICEFYDVYNSLGHGFLESTYEEAMVIALQSAGLRVDRQVPITVYFRGQPIGTYKADIIVESCVVVELKAARAIDSAHEAQLINLLRATGLEVGLLMNFGRRPAFKRLVFANDRKPARG
jgi:GxxExxY protein